MNNRIRLCALLLTAALPLACADPGSDTDDAGASTTTGDTGDTANTSEPTSGTSTGGPPDFYACEEKDFGSSPLAGPAFDAEKGGIQGPLQPSYVLHTTQIYIRAENAVQFGELAGQVSAEAMKTEGLIAYSVGSDNGCGVARTIGIWADEEAMYRLVTSQAHANAMAATTELSYTGRVTHWTATAEEANAYTYDVARAKIKDVAPSEVY